MAIMKYTGNSGAVYYLQARKRTRILYKHLQKLSYGEKWNLQSCLYNQKREKTILHAFTGK